MTEVSNDVIELKADGQLFAPPLDVSALSEQQVIDLLRRIDNTRGRQQEIRRVLEDTEEHLQVASRLIEHAGTVARDPGHQAQLRECAGLTVTLLRKVQEAYEPDGGRSPMERYGLH